MIIKTENFPIFFRDNQNYNDSVRAFIGGLLETESLGKIKYIKSELLNFSSKRRHHYFSEDSEEYLNPQDDSAILSNFSKYMGLGPLEFALATYLLNEDLKPDVLILTGALGSGKSCLCNYVLDYLENSQFEKTDLLYFPQSGQIHRINFNAITDGHPDDVRKMFRKILIDELRTVIQKYHRADMFIEDFLTDVNNFKSLSGTKAERGNRNVNFSQFSEFARLLKRKPNVQTEEAKFDYLLDWINEDDDLAYKLTLLSTVICYIKTRNREKDIDFIFLFDNIDHLSDYSQAIILSVIFSLSISMNKIRMLVPMRLTTFGQIRGDGSYSFSILQNTGQPPELILTKRLEHFLNNPDQYDIPKKLTEQTFTLLKSKIDFVYKCLCSDGDFNRLSNFFSPIAGNSIRRGLFLAERFFVNSCIPYNTLPAELTQERFQTALLVSESSSCKMKNDDRLLTNIFAGYGFRCTLLNIRILQILLYVRDSGSTCTMSHLLSQVHIFEEYSDEEILFSLNMLVHYPKRMIYIEGVRTYSDLNNLAQSVNDVVQITYAGNEYINHLIYDTTYLQNAFLSVQWVIPKSRKNFKFLTTYLNEINELSPNNSTQYLIDLLKNKTTKITDFLPEVINFGTVSSRMQLLRESLYFMMIVDISQLAKYYSASNDEYFFEETHINNSIIINIIASVGMSVLFILDRFSNTEEEREAWLNFLLLAELWHTAFYKNTHETLANTIANYRKKIK